MVGAATALLRFDEGGAPVCCVNFAFSVAMAAAASGNMALMVEGSRPDWRLPVAVLEGRTMEFLAESTFNLFMASLRRLVMGSLAAESQQAADNE